MHIFRIAPLLQTPDPSIEAAPEKHNNLVLPFRPYLGPSPTAILRTTPRTIIPRADCLRVFMGSW
ncbi:hypothetical protein SAMD00023353_0202590 [Rosellinia necatrix]|uniref:Uncharacterized protein n=1 Tax=Rosellinia necatrix TaxID=77044 RepID=A0A1S8A4Z2_ROSNE|nr:hypothetical protein SAMD00023353_0202590 [Rosellinia necatrix]